MKRPIISLMLLALMGTGSLSSVRALDEKRIVAIGDIHGAYDGLVSILRTAELIDAENRWIGGASTLVQTGDLLDRGVQLREVMDLLMSLQDQATEQGGRALVLLGNHEVFNLRGDLADVTPKVFDAFVDDGSEKRRQKAYKEYARWAKRQESLLTAAGLTAESEAEWLESHPVGRLEYQEALGPEGHYGPWLRSLPTIARIDDILFMHGGLAPEFAESNEATINQQINEELERLDRCRAMLISDGLILPTTTTRDMVKMSAARLSWLQAELAKIEQFGGNRNATLERSHRQQQSRIYACVSDYNSWLLTNNRGPHFFRGHATSKNDEALADLTRVLEGWGAKRLVVGHTTMAKGRIRDRFDGQVFFIDTGMLSSVYESGQASALEIRGDQLRAIYVDDSEQLWPEPSTP